MYYPFNYGNAHFIVLDSDDDDFLEGSADSGRLKWLIKKEME